MSLIVELKRLKQEDSKFEASLSYTVRQTAAKNQLDFPSWESRIEEKRGDPSDSREQCNTEDPIEPG